MQPNVRAMTTEEVQTFVDWLQQQIDAEMKVHKLSGNHDAMKRVDAYRLTLSMLRNMGVIDAA